MRKWHIVIPVRPKAVQSVRFSSGGCFVDRKVRQWKAEITKHILLARDGKPPSRLPIAITMCRYVFQLPKRAKKAVREFVAEGGFLPYLSAGDLTDNLSKGLIDCCKEILFEDDRQIVRMSNVEKRYGITGSIELELEEIPGLMSVDGKFID